MQEESNVINFLSIAGAGLIIFLTGLSFLFFRDFFSRNIRFVLPIPPIGVAAYIYIFNLYHHNNGNLTARSSETIKEVLLSVGIMSFAFTAFVIFLIVFIDASRKIL